MVDLHVYFSDFFNVDTDIIESYGAVNISLINDLPLFIDPFLLFNSEKPEYQTIHHSIIQYLLFLKSKAELYPTRPVNPGMMKLWFQFAEIKQTWLGFSLSGNSGRGMGSDFADGLHFGLLTVFKHFGEESVPKSPHMEKLCLISDKVGRDKISDMTTNFAKQYLLEYTQAFAKQYLAPVDCREFTVLRTCFNYDTETWISGKYTLPCYDNNFVLLTPKDMLTRDDTFINQRDMLHNLERIAPSIGDAALRFELDNYFRNVLRRKNKKNKGPTRKEKESAARSLIVEHPELIDYYLRYKEDNKEEATSISKEKVVEVQTFFNEQIKELVLLLKHNTEFYANESNSHDAAYNRVLFLKQVIEDMDGYKLFYIKGKPIKRENDLQIMYRLVWFASSYDVNREVNNGRGSVDFKISKGSRDTTLVEFKLASNSKLKQNLANQVEIYQRASLTDRAIKVILYFTLEELKKCRTFSMNSILRGARILC